MLAIPGLDSGFLHTGLPNSRSKTTASLGSTPATRRYKVRLWRISIHGVRHPFECGLLSLTILNSMAVPSTTAQPILNLSLGRDWARPQLHAGIRRVLRCQFSMELYGPRGGKRGEGVQRGGSNELYIRRKEDYW